MPTPNSFYQVCTCEIKETWTSTGSPLTAQYKLLGINLTENAIRDVLIEGRVSIVHNQKYALELCERNRSDFRQASICP